MELSVIATLTGSHKVAQARIPVSQHWNQDCHSTVRSFFPPFALHHLFPPHNSQLITTHPPSPSEITSVHPSIHSSTLVLLQAPLSFTQLSTNFTMENAPPQLGNIPQYSEMNIPTLQSQASDANNVNGNPSLQNAKDSMMSSEVSYSTNRHRCDDC